MEALRVYCASADPADSAHWIERIATGGQDARFRPMLNELRAARESRAAR